MIEPCRNHDFWRSLGASDPWGTPNDALDREQLKRLAAAPIPGDDDLETALALTSLVLGQFKGFGTDGSQTISNDESRGVLSTVTAVLARHDVTFSPPWRDFDTFKTLLARP